MRLSEGNRQTRRLLGTFPEIPVKVARQMAAALLAATMEAPAPVSTAPLFEVFQAEHETRCGAFYKPEGLRTYRSYVRCELLPAFSNIRSSATVRLSQRPKPISSPPKPTPTPSMWHSPAITTALATRTQPVHGRPSPQWWLIACRTSM
jgi:hypothetical protein